MSSWNEKIQGIKEKLKELISLTLPIKLILGLFVTAIGSASVLGFLSEFAVYNYALVKGFRVPVEGIPYLRPTVSLLSLILIIFSLAGFFIFFLSAKLTVTYCSIPGRIKNLLPDYFKPMTNSGKTNFLTEDMTKSSNKRMITASVGLSLFVTFLVNLIDYFVQKSNGGATINYIDLKYQIAITIVSFLAYLCAFRPNYIKYIAFLSALLSTCLLLGLMFYGSMYSKFLYAIGFGGEREISIIPKDKRETTNGKLLIQSNNFYILLLNDGTVVEFPSQEVDRIKYPQSASFWTIIK